MRRTTSAQLTAARSTLATGSTSVPLPLTFDPSIVLTDTGSVEARSGLSHR